MRRKVNVILYLWKTTYFSLKQSKSEPKHNFSKEENEQFKMKNGMALSMKNSVTLITVYVNFKVKRTKIQEIRNFESLELAKMLIYLWTKIVRIVKLAFIIVLMTIHISRHFVWFIPSILCINHVQLSGN